MDNLAQVELIVCTAFYSKKIFMYLHMNVRYVWNGAKCHSTNFIQGILDQVKLNVYVWLIV